MHLYKDTRNALKIAKKVKSKVGQREAKDNYSKN